MLPVHNPLLQNRWTLSKAGNTQETVNMRQWEKKTNNTKKDSVTV